MLAGLGWANHRAAAGLVLGTEKIQHLSVQSVQSVQSGVHRGYCTLYCQLLGGDGDTFCMK